jgi:hypothetical protein
MATVLAVGGGVVQPPLWVGLEGLPIDIGLFIATEKFLALRGLR